MGANFLSSFISARCSWEVFKLPVVKGKVRENYSVLARFPCRVFSWKQFDLALDSAIPGILWHV